MSLQIGQLRKNQINEYTIDLSYSFSDENKIISNIELYPNKSYYFSFNILCSDSPQIFTLYLVKNNGETTDDIQKIKTYTIAAGDSSLAYPCELILSPNATYDQLIFKAEQNSTLSEITISSLKEIVNILENLGITQLEKIGVQGPSGLLMCINREEIRIGRFEIYEMLSDIKINYVGFIPKKEDDFFIMDYQY